MNRWVQRIVTLGSITGALALAPTGVAFAQDATPQPAAHAGKHHGLVGAALKLQDLTAAQRSQVEQLATQRRTAATPVRQADAQVLQTLAQQVSADKIDTQALAPMLAVERAAAATEHAVDASTLTQLHGILTPAQRTALVDAVEVRAPGGGHGEGGGKLGLSDQQRQQLHDGLKGSAPAGAGQGRAQMRAALESFRGDAFDASALIHQGDAGDRAERFTQALLPVLTPNQRATYSDMLQHRAQAELRTHGKKA